MPLSRNQNIYPAWLRAKFFTLLCLLAGCVTHHDIHLDSQNAAPQSSYATFKIVPQGDNQIHTEPALSDLGNYEELSSILQTTLEQSGFQGATPDLPADFIVSVFPDYLPPGSKPPRPARPPRLADAQIVITSSELESLDPDKKEYWRIILEIYDPTTHDLIWSGYAETSNGKHFRSARNRRNAIESLVAKVPRPGR